MLFAERVWGVIRSWASFAGVGCIRNVVVVKVNWRIASLNVRDVQIKVLSIENQHSDYGRILCGVPQGLILGPLLSLIYVSDMPQTVNSNLL